MLQYPYKKKTHTHMHTITKKRELNQKKQKKNHWNFFKTWWMIQTTTIRKKMKKINTDDTHGIEPWIWKKIQTNKKKNNQLAIMENGFTHITRVWQWYLTTNTNNDFYIVCLWNELELYTTPVLRLGWMVGCIDGLNGLFKWFVFRSFFLSSLFFVFLFP